MPLYEFECRSCHTRFEQLVFNKAKEVVCRNCGDPDVIQLLSTFAVGGSADKSTPEPGPCGSCGAAQRGMCSMLQ